MCKIIKYGLFTEDLPIDFLTALWETQLPKRVKSSPLEFANPSFNTCDKIHPKCRFRPNWGSIARKHKALQKHCFSALKSLVETLKSKLNFELNSQFRSWEKYQSPFQMADDLP